MLRTLYAKLAVVLLGLFCLIGGVLLAVTLFSAQMYQQEVSQKLNRDLAAHIAEKILLKDERINEKALKEVFHMLMLINPSTELYLLDPDGKILGYSASPGKVQRTHVSLKPVEQFLRGQTSLPVLGDDPRALGDRKVFSAAPIGVAGKRQGYLYVILGGEQVDNITQLLQGSYILRLTVWGAGAALLFSLLAGLALFALLTRRLRRLSTAMEAFKEQNFNDPVQFAVEEGHERDEIDRLGITFWEMAERIRTQMARLRETDALRRELVANVSHDLRTPLASLQGYLETLLLKDESLSAQQRQEYLKVAARHTRRLSKLILELFELAKLDSRETEPQVEPFSLAELVHDVAQKFQLRAQEQEIQIETDLNAGAPFAEADIGMIERVLDNLIENALRHTPRGGTVRLSLIPNRDCITLEVADTGCGIPEKELPYIFTRFYHPAPTDRNNPDGTGLGLAIARGIMELHGRELSVRSALNCGTVFSFELPVHDRAGS